MTRFFLTVAICLATSAIAFGQSEQEADGTSEAPFLITIPDSLRTVYTSSREAPLVMETQDVSARRVVREGGADRVEIGALLLSSRDGGSVADLGALLPSTQLTVNSRGEALFLVRGAQERHLRVELDGIPLTLPWDERTDLGLLPLIGVESVAAHRGVSSALDPPNTLAGRIEMTTRRQKNAGHFTRVSALAGEAGELQTSLLHQRRDGQWTSTVAVEHRRRDGFLLAGDRDLTFHQDPTRALRLNTGLRQNTALAHVGRTWNEDVTRLNLLVQASDAEKEIAPEGHVEDARFWRYPQTRRLLVGLSGDTRHGAFRHDAAVSFDLFAQEIESFTDATYRTLDASEANDDRTLLGRWRTTWAVNDRLDLSTRLSARSAHHEDDQGEDGATLTIEQNLLAAGLEATLRPRPEWTLRAGSGYEGATTPKTGDKPSRDGDHEVVVHAAIEFDPDDEQEFHVAASRRPRFVSMRELFSGALDRFEVNPDLGPEVQQLYELGWSKRTRRWELMTNLFWAQVDGSIEQERLENGRRRRVNLDDDVRSVGVEAGVVLRPWRGVTIDWQYTEMRTRREVDGDFDGRLADRPDRLTTLAVQFVHPSGALLRSELVGVGPRFSLDDSKDDPDDPFTELDPSLRLNVRLAWRHYGSGEGRLAWLRGGEVFVRVDNVLDAATESQVGLPESGRTLRLGWRADFGG